MIFLRGLLNITKDIYLQCNSWEVYLHWTIPERGDKIYIFSDLLMLGIKWPFHQCFNKIFYAGDACIGDVVIFEQNVYDQ